MADSFTSDFKRFFTRGMAILLPTAVTLWLLWQAFGFVYNTVAQPINKATRLTVIWVVPRVMDEKTLPEWFRVTDEEVWAARSELDPRSLSVATDASIRFDLRRQYLRKFWNDHAYLNLTGLLIAIMLVYLAGVLLGNFVGKSFYVRLERLITRIPGFKQVYPHVKQVVDMVMGDQKMAFSKVVLVEYPRDKIWSIGFLPGSSVREIGSVTGSEVLTVFIPTSPTPFTGFTINVPKDKVIEMRMSMEEALRYIITAGVLVPEGRTITDPGIEAIAEQVRPRSELGRQSEPEPPTP